MAKGSHPQPVGCPVTCSKNANQHPGTIVAPTKKHTKAEKERDDEMVSLAKKKIDKTKQGAIMQVKQKGIFHGPLVLQTFTVHLSAVIGVVTVPNIGDPDSAKGTLALSAAALALKSGSGIIKVVNESTGKTSGKSTDFNQANWSSVTTKYFTSITANFHGKADKFESLVKEAAIFVQGRNSQHGDSKSVPSNLDDGISLDEHALLIEESEESEDGEAE